MEHEYLIHEHPLIFHEAEKKDGAMVFCKACKKRIWDFQFHYSCEECNFYFHKSCAEQPRELEHPLHPKHRLNLSPVEWSLGKCGGCSGELWGYNYQCSLCDFKLHLKCAALPLSIESKIHVHSLNLVQRAVSFNCDACRKEGVGMFYLCIACPFLVHLDCAFLPLMVKHIRHKHPLNLTYSVQFNQSDHNQICLLCVEKVDTNYRVYYCSNCDFVAHLNCAVDERNRDETFERELQDKDPFESAIVRQSSNLDEYTDALPYFVKKIKLGEDKTEIAVEIKHFSHEHDLELTEEFEANEKCDACVRHIFPPFYSCAQCRFFLHKSCAELPRKKRHSLHQHPLILLPQASYSGGFFQCLACNIPCNGFTYYCGRCGFNLDVQCGSLSDIFIHDGHEHRLILSSGYADCSSCGRWGKIFRCANCEFALDFICSTLPHRVRYKSPFEEVFKLCYTVEDESDEYYCDICEEKRNPKHWFYYCADLSFPAHPKCILGDFPYMKFGKTYSLDIHPHPLTCVQRTKGHTPCDRCNGELSYAGLSFECVKCDFNVDEWCLREMAE
ncbi:hypothetical protein I3760_10G122100 [Carya illinoinensis]|uniref:Phorbol-ester/DAG-type domain-containing protein n=1 Tax=Carya illinoinensis TaxID=32201 RepID=A0A922DX90_CARIL|nr:hypothetical protein I3760_10G122100 [Carya illinoinensis]KAG2685365.1 hypothetical protein I3760_10G122100 [Carya illinoinensis]KAG6692613.1 hypothetical protein I3842_10G123400 [Carya illinoinensis]KAG6692614.1 hypothetical protein I3842_10G123400 [Carya illinoinensis]